MTMMNNPKRSKQHRRRNSEFTANTLLIPTALYKNNNNNSNNKPHHGRYHKRSKSQDTTTQLINPLLLLEGDEANDVTNTNNTTTTSINSNNTTKQQMSRLRLIASYSPIAVALPALLGKPRPEEPKRFFGVVLLADISGFTRLTEQLAQGALTTGSRKKLSGWRKVKQRLLTRTAVNFLQKQGATELARIINSIFTKLIRVIMRNGGDVVKFAGDALLCVWRSHESEHDVNPYALCVAATRASLELQREMHDSMYANVVLTLHSALAAGPLVEVHIGGYQNRWEYMIAGEPIEYIGSAIDVAKSGETVLHKTVYRYVKDVTEGDVIENVGLRIKKLNVLSSETPTEDLVDQFITTLQSNEHCENMLSEYVPTPVMSSIHAGKYTMLGELRQVTILFINLPGFKYETDEELQANQKAFLVIQQTLANFDGALRQLIQDDKGTVAICAFGLPYNSHEHDTLRGVMTAMVIHQHLGMPCGIGIASGGAYCGSVGSECRCEYAIVGDCVNLSARLMCKAGDGILVDNETQDGVIRGRNLHHGLSFENHGKIRVKGKALLIETYKPYFNTQVEVINAGVDMVGRMDELLQFSDMVHGILMNPPLKPPVMLLVADAGLGKTRFVEEATIMAGTDMLCLFSTGNSMTTSIAYSIWRNIIPPLIGTTNENEIAAILEASEICKQDWCLLNIFLNTQFSDDVNDDIMSTATPAKTKNNIMKDQTIRISNIVLCLMKRRLETDCRGILLVVENLQWIDSRSWDIVSYLCTSQLSLPMCILLTKRPTLSNENINILPNCTTIDLKPLDLDDTDQLCRVIMRIPKFPRALSEAIYHVSEGSPLFIHEIIVSLIDSRKKLITTVNKFLGHHKPLEDSDETLQRYFQNLSDGEIRKLAEKITVTSSIEQIMTTRIDSLSAVPQELCKLACIIGLEFDIDILVALSTYSLAQIHSAIEDLIQNAVISSVSMKRYRFIHSTMQDVIYKVLPPNDRKLIHTRVADYMEKTYRKQLIEQTSANTPEIAGRISHHYALACKPYRAVFYAHLASNILLKYHGESYTRLSQLENALKISLGQHNVNVKQQQKTRTLTKQTSSSSSSSNTSIIMNLSPLLLSEWYCDIAFWNWHHGNIDLVYEHIQKAYNECGITANLRIDRLRNKFHEYINDDISYIHTIKRLNDLNAYVACDNVNMDEYNNVVIKSGLLAEVSGNITERMCFVGESIIDACNNSNIKKAIEYYEKGGGLLATLKTKTSSEKARLHTCMAVFDLRRGEWSNASKHLTSSYEIHSKLSMHMNCQVNVNMLAELYRWKGNQQKSTTVFQSLYDWSNKLGSDRFTIISTLGICENLVLLSGYDVVMRKLDNLESKFGNKFKNDDDHNVRYYACLSLARWFHGEHAMSMKFANKALDTISIINFSQIHAYTSLAEVFYRHVLQLIMNEKDTTKSLKLLEKVVNIMKKVVKTAPVTKPRYEIYKAILLWLKHDNEHDNDECMRQCLNHLLTARKHAFKYQCVYDILVSQVWLLAIIPKIPIVITNEFVDEFESNHHQHHQQHKDSSNSELLFMKRQSIRHDEDERQERRKNLFQRLFSCCKSEAMHSTMAKYQLKWSRSALKKCVFDIKGWIYNVDASNEAIVSNGYSYTIEEESQERIRRLSRIATHRYKKSVESQLQFFHNSDHGSGVIANRRGSVINSIPITPNGNKRSQTFIFQDNDGMSPSPTANTAMERQRRGMNHRRKQSIPIKQPTHDRQNSRLTYHFDMKRVADASAPLPLLSVPEHHTTTSSEPPSPLAMTPPVTPIEHKKSNRRSSLRSFLMTTMTNSYTPRMTTCTTCNNHIANVICKECCMEMCEDCSELIHANDVDKHIITKLHNSNNMYDLATITTVNSLPRQTLIQYLTKISLKDTDMMNMGSLLHEKSWNTFDAAILAIHINKKDDVISNTTHEHEQREIICKLDDVCFKKHDVTCIDDASVEDKVFKIVEDVLTYNFGKLAIINYNLITAIWEKTNNSQSPLDIYPLLIRCALQCQEQFIEHDILSLYSIEYICSGGVVDQYIGPSINTTGRNHLLVGESLNNAALPPSLSSSQSIIICQHKQIVLEMLVQNEAKSYANEALRQWQRQLRRHKRKGSHFEDYNNILTPKIELKLVWENENVSLPCYSTDNWSIIQAISSLCDMTAVRTLLGLYNAPKIPSTQLKTLTHSILIFDSVSKQQMHQSLPSFISSLKHMKRLYPNVTTKIDYCPYVDTSNGENWSFSGTITCANAADVINGVMFVLGMMYNTMVNCKVGISTSSGYWNKNGILCGDVVNTTRLTIGLTTNSLNNDVSDNASIQQQQQKLQNSMANSHAGSFVDVWSRDASCSTISAAISYMITVDEATKTILDDILIGTYIINRQTSSPSPYSQTDESSSSSSSSSPFDVRQVKSSELNTDVFTTVARFDELNILTAHIPCPSASSSSSSSLTSSSFPNSHDVEFESIHNEESGGTVVILTGDTDDVINVFMNNVISYTDRGCSVFSCATANIDVKSGWKVAIQLLQQILKTQIHYDDIAANPTELHKAFEYFQPELCQHLSLLNIFGHPFHFEPTIETDSLDSAGRATYTTEVVLAFLDMILRHQAVVFIVDNVKNIDTLSLQLLLRAIRILQNSLLVIKADKVDDIDVLSGLKHTHLHIEPLSNESISSVLITCLGMINVDDELVALIANETKGSASKVRQIISHMLHGTESNDWSNMIRHHGFNISTSNRLDCLSEMNTFILQLTSIAGELIEMDMVKSVMNQMKNYDDTNYNSGVIWKNLNELINNNFITIINNSNNNDDDDDDDDGGYKTWAYISKSDQILVYNEMHQQLRHKLHRYVASYLELNCVSNDVLAYHYRRSDDEDKYLHYTLVSAQLAFQNGAHREAIDMFQEVLTKSSLLSVYELAGVQFDLARSFRNLGYYSESSEHLVLALNLLDHKVNNVEAGRTLYSQLDELASNESPLFQNIRQNSPRLYNQQQPAPPPQYTADIRTSSGSGVVLKQLLQHAKVIQSTSYMQLADDLSEENKKLHLALRSYELYSQNCVRAGDSTRGLFCVLEAVRLSEHLECYPSLVQSYALLSLYSSAFGYRDIAKAFNEHTKAMIDESSSKHVVPECKLYPRSWTTVGLHQVMDFIGRGDWKHAIAFVNQYRKNFSGYRNREYRSIVLSLGTIYFLRGDFTRSAGTFNGLYTMAQATRDMDTQKACMNLQAYVSLLKGDNENAMKCLQTAEMFSYKTARPSITNQILSSWVSLRVDDVLTSSQDLNTIFANYCTSESWVYHNVLRHMAISEFLLELISRVTAKLCNWSSETKESRDLYMELQQDCNAKLAMIIERLTRFTSTFPFGRCILRLLRGVEHAIRRQWTNACNSWLEAANIAESQGMSYYEAYAHFLIGSQYSIHSTKHRTHLLKARELLYKYNSANHLLELTESALLNLSRHDMSSEIHVKVGPLCQLTKRGLVDMLNQYHGEPQGNATSTTTYNTVKTPRKQKHEFSASPATINDGKHNDDDDGGGGAAADGSCIPAEPFIVLPPTLWQAS